ncbi:MAG TPA: LssY C-terminal domain-containing protein [Gemmatimonadaceae bacterium]|nr:LssY C-terminal domain-containing protein [Gemmatimonadaceae bacterium]
MGIVRNSHRRTRIARALSRIPLYIARVFPGAAGRARTLPAGTALHVRLLDMVGSDPTMRGRPVRALVIAPAPGDTTVIVAPGAVVRGTIVDAGAESDGPRRQLIALRFTEVVLPDGRTAPISAQVSGVDNARETVDAAGRVLGLPMPGRLESMVDWALLALGTVHPVAAAALFIADHGEEHEQHRPIVFPPGVELTLRTTADARVPVSPWRPPLAVDSPARLDALIHDLPPRAFARGGRIAGDLVNLVLIGEPADIHAAFLAAGWDTPERLSVRTCFDTFVAMVEARDYAHQPVSQLLLDGRPPDLVFQKLTDTFAKRHHVRIWRSDVAWAGHPVFAAAATHDVGIELSTEEHTCTHRTDPAIDLERDKIVDDLVTANAVAALSLVPRTPIAGTTVTGGQATVLTDWRVAVIALGAVRQ